MSAVEAVGDAEDCRQPFDAAAEGAVEPPVILMRFLGCGAPVVAGHGGDGDLLLGGHSEQVGVEDQVVRVLVVLVVVDVVADVVEQRGVGQHLPVARLAANAVANGVEELQRQALHVVGMWRLVVRPLGQLANRPRPCLAGVGDRGGDARGFQQQPFANPVR